MLDRVGAAWGQAVLPPPLQSAEAARLSAAREATASQAAHQADVQSRHVLSSALQRLGSLPEAERRRVAGELNAERQQLMEVLKSVAADAPAALLEAWRTRCDDVVYTLCPAKDSG